jgi:hypothetical protein
LVWKKLSHGYIAKLLVPAAAKRTATPIGRKCRASKAKVLEIYDRDGKLQPKAFVGCSTYTNFEYKAGRIVKPVEPYNPDIRVECTSGIHFFLTREEAEAYN